MNVKQCQAPADSRTKSTNLDCKSVTTSAGCYRLLSPFNITQPETDTYFTISWTVEDRVDLDTSIRLCSPCPRALYHSGICDTHKLSTVGFSSGISPQSGMLPLDHVNPCSSVEHMLLMDTGFKQIPRSQWEDTFWRMPQQPASVYVKAVVKFASLRSMTGYLLTFSLSSLTTNAFLLLSAEKCSFNKNRHLSLIHI